MLFDVVAELCAKNAINAVVDVEWNDNYCDGDNSNNSKPFIKHISGDCVNILFEESCSIPFLCFCKEFEKEFYSLSSSSDNNNLFLNDLKNCNELFKCFSKFTLNYHFFPTPSSYFYLNLIHVYEN
jgi:hypothetical protein